MKASIAAIICSAGSSKRMRGRKKEYMRLGSLTVLGSAVSAFASCPRIGPIIVTEPPDGKSAAAAYLPPDLLTRVFFVTGGPSRRASVYNALSFLESHKTSYVLIHDGARPWIKKDLIEKTIDAVIRFGAVIPALPLIETPKELGAGLCLELSTSENAEFITRHLRREKLCTAQTPQGFKFPEILRAHEKAREREEKEGFLYTDDAEIWGEFAGKVAVIPGDIGNRKITYPEDLAIC